MIGSTKFRGLNWVFQLIFEQPLRENLLQSLDPPKRLTHVSAAF
jgi:hypothetical protein